MPAQKPALVKKPSAAKKEFLPQSSRNDMNWSGTFRLSKDIAEVTHKDPNEPEITDVKIHNNQFEMPPVEARDGSPGILKADKFIATSSRSKQEGPLSKDTEDITRSS